MTAFSISDQRTGKPEADRQNGNRRYWGTGGSRWIFRSAVYTTGTKIPKPVSPEIMDRDKAENDFTGEALKK